MTEGTNYGTSGPSSGKRGRIIAWVVSLLAIASVTAGIMLIILRPSPLESAHETCREEADGLAIYDEDSDEITLTGAFMAGSEVGAALGRDQASAFECLIDELDVPQRIILDMQGTSSIQGQQSADWDGFTAHWTYHPNRGLDLLIERQ